nr:PsaJ [Trichosanthes laceribractea]
MKRTRTSTLFSARSKNISLRGTGSKYYMVRGFSGSINRDQSFIPGCVGIPIFFILVIDLGRGEED